MCEFKFLFTAKLCGVTRGKHPRKDNRENFLL